MKKILQVSGMDTQPSHSIPRTEKKNKNYYWNAHQDDYFIDLMVNEVSRGRKTGGVFHKDAWNAMTKAMKAKYGEDFDKDRLRNRLKTIKGQYSNVKQLLQQSGFWWNEETKMVTGDEAVWDDFIQEHAWAAKYRKTAVRKYGDMAICFGDPVVDGSFSQTGHDAPLKESTPLGDATPNDLTGGMSPADFGSPIFDLVEKVSQASSSGGNARASSTACKKRRRSSSLVVPRMIQAGLTQQVTETLSAVIDTMRQMATATATSTPNPTPTPTPTPSRERQCLAIVEEEYKEELPEEVYMKATDLFENQVKVNMLLALDPRFRRSWLDRQFKKM